MIDEYAVLQMEYDALLVKPDKTPQEWHRIEIIEAQCLRAFGPDFLTDSSEPAS